MEINKKMKRKVKTHKFYNTGKTGKNIVCQPYEGHSYTFIFCHGLDSSPQINVSCLLKTIIKSLGENVKCIFPWAPCTRSTVMNQDKVNSWFDLQEYDFDNEGKNWNLEEMQDATQTILDMIDEEAKELEGDYSKIFLGGKSQGCMLSYNVLQHLEHTIGGLITAIGHPVLIHKDKITEESKKIPIYAFHGKDDDIVSESAHSNGIKLLTDIGYNIEYEVIEGLGHTTGAAFKAGITLFLQKIQK